MLLRYLKSYIYNSVAELRIMTLKKLLDSLSFDEIAPFRIRHYHTIMRQEIFFVDLLPKIFCPRLDNTLGKEIRIDVAYYE